MGVLRHNCTPSNSPTAVVSNTVSVPIDTVVKGSTITWTLKVSDFPSGVKIGSVLSPALGETRTIVGAATTAAATAPVIDETATQATTYKIGQ
ncbi:MAG: hypothetical protein JWL79_1318 [Frankiales bacterium]|nr:hypothetical protein [Frankiales bacterium]